MNLKITNLSKFIRGIIIIIGILICISIFVSSTSFSHVDVSYKTIYISNGDTLWDIAKDEKQNNLYYQNKDIRDIISNIKLVNNLSGSDLSTNQSLVIPYT